LSGARLAIAPDNPGAGHNALQGRPAAVDPELEVLL
jgi:hypothetical protein